MRHRPIYFCFVRRRAAGVIILLLVRSADLSSLAGPDIRDRPRNFTEQAIEHRERIAKTIAGRGSIDDLKTLQLMREFFLISSIVRLPFETLVRLEWLVLAGLGCQPVICALKHFGHRPGF